MPAKARADTIPAQVPMTRPEGRAADMFDEELMVSRVTHAHGPTHADKDKKAAAHGAGRYILAEKQARRQSCDERLDQGGKAHDARRQMLEGHVLQAVANSRRHHGHAYDSQPYRSRIEMRREIFRHERNRAPNHGGARKRSGDDAEHRRMLPTMRKAGHLAHEQEIETFCCDARSRPPQLFLVCEVSR